MHSQHFFNDTCISVRTSWMHHCLKNGSFQVTTQRRIITPNLVSLPFAQGVAFSKVKLQRHVLRQLQKLTNVAIDITAVLQFFSLFSRNSRKLSPAVTVSDSAALLLP